MIKINPDDFIQRYYPNAIATRQRDVKRFLSNLNEVAGDMPPEQALKDKTILCRAFYLQDVCGISRPHYQKIKEYLLNILEMCGVNGTVPTRDEVISSRDKIDYFRGLNELMEFIDAVGESVRGEEYNPTEDLVIVKSICVFGWFGYSPDEIAELKKGDLTLVGYDTYVFYHKDRECAVKGEAFAALYYLCDLEGYNALPNGKRMAFGGDTSFLFRPTIHSEKVVGNGIVQILRRFNTQIPANFAQQAILFRNLRKNALFIEIYEDESDRPLLSKITSIMKCNPNQALSYKSQYLKFVEAIENDII